MSFALSKWEKRFMDMARLVATWSRDPSSKVGAVIVDRRKRVVSVGFNGFPAGVDDTIVSREQKILRTVHAEGNAILFAQRDLTGCTIFTTHPPCAQCAALIVQSGITRVVSPIPTQDFASRWKDHCDEALTMFAEAGVQVVQFEDVCSV